MNRFQWKWILTGSKTCWPYDNHFAPFWICSNPNSCHTLRWIFLQSFIKFNERNPNFFLILPFLFPWQLRKSLSNDFDFSGLSRSTRCGCCSLQVLSISIRRVTCYDHFCVFQLFLHFGRFHGSGGQKGRIKKKLGFLSLSFI
jgi:hypothetical protein